MWRLDIKTSPIRHEYVTVPGTKRILTARTCRSRFVRGPDIKHAMFAAQYPSVPPSTKVDSPRVPVAVFCGCPTPSPPPPVSSQ